jgi:ubiquinone/menaquinone biosynthesis C-methylase UbiE
MGYYDWFARVYDASLEKVYAEHRELAARALQVAADSVVLDVPCGTGQSFAAIARGLGSQGVLLGVDASAGMLARARARGGAGVRCLEADAATLTRLQISEALGRDVAPNRLHVFLGMSVFRDMDATFSNLWSLLAPGGQCVLVDVHAERLSLQGRLVNKLARAEIRRRFWEPLERVALDFERHPLPFDRRHGGQIMLARGRKL